MNVSPIWLCDPSDLRRCRHGREARCCWVCYLLGDDWAAFILIWACIGQRMVVMGGHS